MTTFDDFYRVYRLFVHALCRKRALDEGEAGDLESLVWLDVHRRFAEYQEGEPRLLLYRLVQWRANDLYRKRQRESDAKEAIDVEDEALCHWLGRGSFQGLPPDTQMAIREALFAETSENRHLLFDRFVEELTLAELAARHQMHRNTAHKRLTEAIKRLKARLDGLRW